MRHKMARRKPLNRKHKRSLVIHNTRKPFEELSSRHKRRIARHKKLHLSSLCNNSWKATSIDPVEGGAGTLVSVENPPMAMDIDLPPSPRVVLDDSVEGADLLQDERQNSSNSPRQSSSITDSESEESVVNETFRKREKITFQNRIRALIIESKMTQANANALLNILNDQPSLPPLPKSSKTLLKTPRKKVHLRPVEPGKYLHIGIKTAIVRQLKFIHDSLIPQELVADVFTDGGKVHESGFDQAWLIMLGFVNITKCKPVTTGIFLGKHKPFCCFAFFREFVEEYNSIKREGGIEYNGRKILLKLRCFLGDGPARAFMLNVKGHMSTEPCSKCKIRGRPIKAPPVKRKRNYDQTEHKDEKKRRLLPPTTAAPRTSEDFIACKYMPAHQKGPSPLFELGIDPVKKCPYDYMHEVCLGIMERLLAIFRKGKYEPTAQLSTGDYKFVCDYLEELRSHCPTEFSRKPRTLEEESDFKATEYRTLLLYTGPVVFYNVLPQDQYRHFLVLHACIRVLVSNHRPDNLLEFVKGSIELWLKRSVKLYGDVFMCSNAHGLTHLVEDVRHLGQPLDEFSAFKYENEMGWVRRMSRKNNQTLQQIANRLAEYYSQNFKAPAPPEQTKTIIASDPHRNGPIPLDSPIDQQYNSVRFNDLYFTTRSKSKANCCCLLKDGSVCLIENILTIKGSFYFYVKRFENKRDFYKIGNPSTVFGVHECESPSLTAQLVEATLVTCKGFLMPLKKAEVADRYVVVELQKESLKGSMNFIY